jgi:hypothetical protein
MTAGRDGTTGLIRLHGPYRPRIANPRAERLSGIYDCAADMTWFRTHPEATDHYRWASDLELSAYGLPPGTVVVVIPHGGELFYYFASRRPAERSKPAGGP